MFEGQIREIAPLSPGKLGLFLILSLFFHPSLPKIGHSHPVKNYFLEKIWNVARLSKSFVVINGRN